VSIGQLGGEVDVRAPADPDTGAVPADEPVAANGFSVHLDEFEGPFDLLLSLIAKHRLDVTVLALHRVVDDFVAHVRSAGPAWDLDETTEFLVVAATLLDLKAARLLPSGEVEDEDDVALLEARDLLFARLLQYRAIKAAAQILSQRLLSTSRRFPRVVSLEPRFAGLLPDVLIGLGPVEFAALASRAVAPRPAPAPVAVEHLHTPRVSIREQAAILAVRLRRSRTATFAGLTADCRTTLLVVGRFLALLELFRSGAVAFEQDSPLGELRVRWVGAEEGEVELAGDAESSGAPVPPGQSQVRADPAGARERPVELLPASLVLELPDPAPPQPGDVVPGGPAPGPGAAGPLPGDEQ
jgi:segregation and condensation protein A